MTEHFRYSIIMPLYNKADWLLRSLNSLLAQTYSNFEMIIVDDCSTDDSLQIVRNFAAQHPNLDIKLINSAINQGPGACRNRGMKESRGTHLLFLDADDTFHPELLSRLNEAFTQKNTASDQAVRCVIFGYEKQPDGVAWLFDDTPDWLHPVKDDLFLLQPVMACFDTRRFLVRTSNVAVSASAVKGLNFDTSRATFEGISFWFQVLQRCSENHWSVVYLRQSLHTVFTISDSEIHKPLPLSQSKLPQVFRRYALSKNRCERAFCQRICTTWFWHEFSRLSGGISKVLFFVKFAYVLPFLSRQYQKPIATAIEVKNPLTSSQSES